VGQGSFIDRVKPIKSLIVEKAGCFAVDESNKSSNQKLFFPVPNPLQQLMVFTIIFDLPRFFL